MFVTPSPLITNMIRHQIRATAAYALQHDRAFLPILGEIRDAATLLQEELDRRRGRNVHSLRQGGEQ